MYLISYRIDNYDTREVMKDAIPEYIIYLPNIMFTQQMQFRELIGFAIRQSLPQSFSLSSVCIQQGQ